MSKQNKKTEETKPVYEIKFDDNTAAFEKDILEENQPKLSYLTRLFHYIFSSAKAMCGIYLGLAIALSVLQPITAFIWGRYIDKANYFSENMEYFTVQAASLIGLALLYWFISSIGDLLSSYLYGLEDIQRLSKVQHHRFQEKFQAKLFEKISRLYPDYMEVPKINDIINRSFNAVGYEWSSLQRGVIIGGYDIIAGTVSVVMVAASLYIFHPLLCLIVIIAQIPTLYTQYVGNKLNFKFSRDNEEVLRKAGYYQDVLLGASAKEVKALNLFAFFFGKWKALSDDYLIREKKNQTNVFFLNLAGEIVYNISYVAAIILAIVLMTQGKLSVGALSAVFVLTSTLLRSSSRLFRSIARFISKKNDAAQFFELIDLNEQMMKGPSEEKSLIDLQELEVQNVTYRYPLTNEYRIKNVSFTIRKGEKVAFVGENGAGKTTFVKLLTGMLQPSGGEILINGRSIKDIDHSDQYNSTSCVFQEPARFNTFTIADNVFLGDVDRKRDEKAIDRALEFAGFEEETDRDALLGKDIGGTDLSGGQWQKLAIARAYYRGRDFIILDEPTSNLDPFAETEVFKKYLAMMEGKTVIIVTHRISVASLVDRVVVFKDGEIVEDDIHDDLLQNNGEYARLYSTQAKWYDR